MAFGGVIDVPAIIYTSMAYGNNVTISGSISGAGQLFLEGNDTITSPSISVKTLVGDAGTNMVSSTISGSAAVTLNAGTLVLSGSNTYTHGTTVSSGVLDFATTAAQPRVGTTTVSASATLAHWRRRHGLFQRRQRD